MKGKFKGGFKGFFNKKENIAIMAVAAVFCAGIVVTEMKAGDIPLHDGDVLVDSRNIAQAEIEPQPGGNESDTESSDTAQGTKDDDKEGTDEQSDGGVFAEKRASLELERNELIAKYDETIKNSTSEGEKKNAVEKKETLTKYMEQEISVENILASKNLPECLVIITDSTVTVTVDEQDLKQNTVAKICNVVMEETGRSADKIIIQSNY